VDFVRSRPTTPDDGFDRFWAKYPRHVARQAALKAWQKINPSEDLVNTMLEALAWQVRQPGWTKDGGVYIPHGSTWLNQARWEDEPFHAPTMSKATASVVQALQQKVTYD